MFAYLSKKIGMPKKDNVVMSICWNQEHGWVACGGEGGLLKVIKLDSSKGQGGGNLSMNQNLQGHTGTTRVVVWNENYYKLTTSDDTGLIIVWMLHKGQNAKTQWIEEMINNRNKSTVRDMKWTPDGEKICIVYEDGAVIVGSVAGHRLWGKDLEFNLASVEWSPDGRTILFGTTTGEVHVYDYVGNYLLPVKIACLAAHEKGIVGLAGIQWYDTSKINYLSYDVGTDSCTLAIAYSNGKIQFMCNETDADPLIVDTGMNITQIRWSPNGNILAVAGSAPDHSTANTGAGAHSILEMGEHPSRSAVVQFYTSRGLHARTLKIPSQRGIAEAISWEGFGSRLAIGADTSILFSNIQPEYLWTYFLNTVVFAYRKPDRQELSLVFWDTNIDEKHIKIVKRLDKVVSCGGDYCLLVMANPKPDGKTPTVPGSLYTGQTWVLQLCNAVGSPIDSKVITIEPIFVAMNLTHVVVCNHDTVYIWEYRETKHKHVPLETLNREKPTSTSALRSKPREVENVFQVDETPSLEKSRYDKDRYYNRTVLQGGTVPMDAICAVAAGEGYFAVARGNGVLQHYSLTPLSKERTLSLKCKPQHMQFNCNASRLAVIDIFGLFSLYDLDAAVSGAADGGYIATERKDVWCMVWASDKPETLALMEKNRLYVMHGSEAEEAVLTSGYICQLKELVTKTILLEDVMQSPEQLKNIGSMIQEFETRALKDTREFLGQTAHSKKEQLAYVEERAHPRLWQLMAENALDKLDLGTAELAFVKAKDYRGVLFVGRVSSIADKNMQKAEIASYFKRFDEAEQIYRDIDRKDLALELRMRTGDWNKVIQLIDQGAGDDALLKIAHNNLGDYWAERHRWKKAAHYYSLAQNNEALVEAYYREEDFVSLEKLIDVLPATSPLLERIANRFQSLGIAEGAVRALKKLGDLKRAVDVCVLLNYWDLAVELAENHNFVQIEGLLSRYADHLMQKNKQMEAIELYRKSNKNTEAAKLLAKIADDLNSRGVPPLLVKKIYVLAALEVDSYKQRVLDMEMNQITGQATGATAQTLNSLITTDINTSADKALSNPWKGAEAFHFYLLTQRHFYQKDYKKALKTAIRLKEYEKELGAKTVYGLVALAAYLNQSYHECSKALVKLERLPETEVTMSERMKYEELAISIFSNHSPSDGQKIMFRCPKCGAQVNEYDITCGGCGSYFSPCIASGQSILTRGYTQCRRCKKKMILTEIKSISLRNCPLCHHKLQELEEMGPDD